MSPLIFVPFYILCFRLTSCFGKLDRYLCNSLLSIFPQIKMGYQKNNYLCSSSIITDRI